MLINNLKKLTFILLAFTSFYTFAGVDVVAKIQHLHIKGDGKLWLKLDSAIIDQHCKKGWHDFNVYIKTDDKNYPFYFALLASAHSKGQRIRLSNISMFDGTTACDIAATGYGVVVYE
jgi:hypothetical protein